MSELETKIREILAGIDQTECDTNDGWWEAPMIAEFGLVKLGRVIEVCVQHESKLTDLEAENEALKAEVAQIRAMLKYYEKGLVELTKPLDDHPEIRGEFWEGPCLCFDCRNAG